MQQAAPPERRCGLFLPLRRLPVLRAVSGRGRRRCRTGRSRDFAAADAVAAPANDPDRATGKVAALSETGQASIDDPEWFTGRLLKSIYGYPGEPVELAYVAVWRNSTRGFYTPYEGHPATEDFLKFLDDERVVTAWPYDWLGMYYHLTE